MQTVCAGRRPKILVVDDEPANIELMAGLFEETCDVLFATRGEKALEIAAAVAPDLILLDVMLPGMDGFAICRQLKTDLVTKDIPIIFVTALGDTQAETRGLELGAVDYITKPINPAVVKMRVRNQIELKQARDQLACLATTDGLTGLANRRRFDEVLALENTRLSRSGAHLGLILLDIDHFKAFNDVYGHVRGDDCLRLVGRVVASHAQRASDLAARYGGEEFACILPESKSLQGVAEVAESIRQDVMALGILHEESPTAPVVTVSLGVVWTSVSSSPAELVAAVDRLLYQAKSLGRNRVCVALPEQAPLEQLPGGSG